MVRLSLRMNLADILINEEIIIEKLNDIHKNSVHFFLKLWYEEDRIKLEQVKEFLMKNEDNLHFKKQNLKKRSYYGQKQLFNLIKKLQNDQKNKILIRSLIVSPQKYETIQNLFKISIDTNLLKKNLISKKISNKKFNKIDEKKLLEFVNITIKTNFKYNEKRNNFSEIALNSHSKWDSLAHAKLLSTIEKKFKISINEKNIDQFSNLRLIFNYLNKLKVIW